VTPRRGGLHHLELWVADLAAAERSWGWLLDALGYVSGDPWPAGRTWTLGDAYIVIEQSPALSAPSHDRCRPGMNHVAFHAGTPDELDAIVRAAPDHGWTLLFPDRHPHAGGPQHHAAYLTDAAGFEVELVA
jgi:catechol 2,3-dioxygenase-like lactoylglutathione lyase family enzyme